MSSRRISDTLLASRVELILISQAFLRTLARAWCDGFPRSFLVAVRPTAGRLLQEPLRTELAGFLCPYFGAVKVVSAAHTTEDGEEVPASSFYFLVIMDMNSGFDRPCTMDIKMGRVTVEPGEREVRRRFWSGRGTIHPVSCVRCLRPKASGPSPLPGCGRCGGSRLLALSLAGVVIGCSVRSPPTATASCVVKAGDEGIRLPHSVSLESIPPGRLFAAGAAPLHCSLWARTGEEAGAAAQISESACRWLPLRGHALGKLHRRGRGTSARGQEEAVGSADAGRGERTWPGDVSGGVASSERAREKSPRLQDRSPLGAWCCQRVPSCLPREGMYCQPAVVDGGPGVIPAVSCPQAGGWIRRRSPGF